MSIITDGHFLPSECSFGDCVNFREKARLPCTERCARPFYFCCQKPLNDGLVECARRENCPRGGWFHLNKKCSGLVEAPEGEGLWRLGIRRGIEGTAGVWGMVTDGSGLVNGKMVCMWFK